jgi:DNA-binding beta-propeller fold protein YncE
MLHTRRHFFGIGIALAALQGRVASAQSATLTTLVGTGVAGTASSGVAAADAQINDPYGITGNPAGTGLFWVDNRTHRVLALDFASMTLVVIAGTGTAGYSGDGGPAFEAQLAQPHELCFDSKGKLYIADRDNHVVRCVDMASGLISIAAGIAGSRGFSGDSGLATAAEFNQPHGIAFDAADNLYVCDLLNHRVRRVDAATGMVTTFAGSGASGRTPDTGPLLQAAIEGPRALQCTAAGKIYLALREGNSVFELDGQNGELRRIAGNGQNGYSGDGGPAVAATFGAAAPGGLTGPKGLCVSEDGSTLYVADCENHVIRRVDLESGLISTVAGTGVAGNGVDGAALQCQLNRPHAVFHQRGMLYITDSSNHRIRVLVPA